MVLVLPCCEENTLSCNEAKIEWLKSSIVDPIKKVIYLFISIVEIY